MIILDKTHGQLGNKLLNLNNLMQLAFYLGVGYRIVHDKDPRLTAILKLVRFKPINSQQLDWTNHSRTVTVSKTDLLTHPLSYFKDLSRRANIRITFNCLGELFFKYNVTDPKQFFEFREDLLSIVDTEIASFPKHKTLIGVHLRYEPRINPKLSFTRNEDELEKYYINSIKHCLHELDDCHFIITGPNSTNQFTDKVATVISQFKFYQRLINFLEQNKISYSYSITITDPTKHYILDFIQLSLCNVIISSQSTFCICAGFLQKNKKIIHSAYLVNNFRKLSDTFWVQLFNGGNQYYKIWQLI